MNGLGLGKGMLHALAVLALAAGVAVPTAGASSLSSHYGYDDDCRGGGCGNEREEDYSGAGCKYFCPTFDKSPVDLRDNNVTICMPFSVCGEKPSEGKAQEQ